MAQKWGEEGVFKMRLALEFDGGTRFDSDACFTIEYRPSQANAASRRVMHLSIRRLALSYAPASYKSALMLPASIEAFCGIKRGGHDAVG